MSEILLIGNGPSCLEYEYGELIDSHDIVVRFNNFKLESFEKFVGTKTNYWVRTIKSDIHHNTDFDKKFFVYPSIVRLSEKQLTEISSTGYDIVSTLFYDKINTLLNNRSIWATTGLLMIYYFIEKGYTVKIHGFDFFKSGMHYYKDDCVLIGHDPRVEENLVAGLIKEGKVKFL